MESILPKDNANYGSNGIGSKQQDYRFKEKVYDVIALIQNPSVEASVQEVVGS